MQVWPVTDVQALMGHSDVKTTMGYVHHVPKHDAAAVLALRRKPNRVPAMSRTDDFGHH